MNFLSKVEAENPRFARTYIAGITYELRQLKVIVLKSPTDIPTKAVWIGWEIIYLIKILKFNIKQLLFLFPKK